MTKDDQVTGTLARGLTILQVVAERGQVTVGAIATELGISRSATYRLVGQLRERDFLSEHSDGRVTLGSQAVRLGLRALAGVDLYKLAAPQLRNLVEDVVETAFLAIVENDVVVYVLQEVGPNAVTMTATPGSHRPLHATGLGKAYLAALPAEQRDRVLRRIALDPVTPDTITSLPRFRSELEATTARGYAIDNGELEPEVRCIAAAIVGHDGLPVAAISVGGPSQRIMTKQDGIVQAVRATADTVSGLLGASLPDTRQRPDGGQRPDGRQGE